MAKYGEAFAKGIERNRMALGVAPKFKKPNMPLQTLKYFPGELARTTGRALGWMTGISAIKKRLKKGRSI